ncbi:nucleotide exchange factor GrpE [Helicobacter canadensis]|uniref:Protein GrpE n=1 Tax=Helicobacter canadensis MIT 98-5491 TaxID=537970 RepID=C5ZV55_9HELI|nr:heat shock protein GrpE [Helicobacter canadensis MIT 98-5491]EFR47905.1 co-chaperone GrpE [Helicobacter canadensis MIT 98-5491]STO99158.1 heat shock protein GrpE [Helicobacter canadensis]
MQDENEKIDSSGNENQEQELQENAEQDSKESLQNKIKELEDQYLRTYADFENTKKRLVREKDQALEYAYEKIAKDLLPSIDTLEIALKTIKDSKENSDQAEILGKIEEGIALTLDNLLKTLAKHGIEPIDANGEFDPNFHDAIMQVQSDSHNVGEIVAEMQKGYKYKERVLRPSMVSIAK